MEHCEQHPTEEIRYFCVPCDTPICESCRTNDHSGHDSKSLQDVLPVVKRELEKNGSRVHACKDKVESALRRAKEERGALLEKRKSVEELLAAREKKLLELFREECKLAREEILESLTAVTKEMQVPVLKDEARIQEKLQAAVSLQEEVKQALDSDDVQKILKLRDDTKGGTGDQDKLHQLTSDLSIHRERPVLHCEDLVLQKDAIRSFLGHVAKVKPVMMSPGVKMKRLFTCSDDDIMCDVHAVCPLEDGRVWVAYGDAEGAGKVALFTAEGEVVRAEPIKGRVSVVRVNDDWMRVEGIDFKPRFMTAKESTETTYSSQQRQYAVYSKLAIRYEVFLQKPGTCDLRSVKVLHREPIGTAYTRLNTISLTHPIAMDVSKDGKLFAILHEGEDHVLIYHQGYTQPVCGYTGDDPNFKPRDVCFCGLGGKERLVVADWQGDSLHVLDVSRTGCTFLGHLGGGCPLLVKPTALCPDTNGWLWIGCSGGHILTIEEITSSYL